VQSSFQCWVLSRATEEVSFTSPENPKAFYNGETAAFPIDDADTLPSPVSLVAAIGIDQPLPDG